MKIKIHKKENSGTKYFRKNSFEWFLNVNSTPEASQLEFNFLSFQNSESYFHQLTLFKNGMFAHNWLSRDQALISIDVDLGINLSCIGLTQ